MKPFRYLETARTFEDDLLETASIPQEEPVKVGEPQSLQQVLDASEAVNYVSAEDKIAQYRLRNKLSELRRRGAQLVTDFLAACKEE